MKFAVDDLSALHLIRALRNGRGTPIADLPRCNVVAPDPTPNPRLTRDAIAEGPVAELDPNWATVTIHVAVPSKRDRIQSKRVKCSVYEHGIPDGSFLDLGNGIVCAGPELLFLEMSRKMSVPVLVLLGYELCGTFSRDADNPRTGKVAMGIPPATSVDKIRSFLDGCGRIKGKSDAAWALGYVADNAWSAMEALLACLVSLGFENVGYGLGPVVLNKEEKLPELVDGYVVRSSRIPDLLFAGTCVGLNYDGRGHLDFSEVEKVCEKLMAEQPKGTGDGGDSGGAARADVVKSALEKAERGVRAKVLDDIARDRELAATGYVVLPVTSEDLVSDGGLDALMAVVVSTLEKFSDKDVSGTRYVLEHRRLTRERQLLIWSLFPWDKASAYAREIQDRLRRAFSGAREEVEIIRLDELL